MPHIKEETQLPRPTVPGTIIDQELNAFHASIASELRKHPAGFLLAVSPRLSKMTGELVADKDDFSRDMAPIDLSHLPLVLPTDGSFMARCTTQSP